MQNDGTANIFLKTEKKNAKFHAGLHVPVARAMFSVRAGASDPMWVAVTNNTSLHPHPPSMELIDGSNSMPPGWLYAGWPHRESCR